MEEVGVVEGRVGRVGNMMVGGREGGGRIMHIRLRMDVFGEEYWSDEMLYACTKLKTVYAVQQVIAEALLKLNKVKDLKKVESK